jgi:hypothetical protein
MDVNSLLYITTGTVPLYPWLFFVSVVVAKNGFIQGCGETGCVDVDAKRTTRCTGSGDGVLVLCRPGPR